MLSFVALQLFVLLAAAVLLAFEARTGRMRGASERRTVARAMVFLLAAVAGATLLIALADREVLFALALLPLTALSLLRFVTLARDWWSGWRLPVLTCALVGMGVVMSIPWVPVPLDRTAVIRELHGVEAVPVPETIDPEALRPVRA